MESMQMTHLHYMLTKFTIYLQFSFSENPYFMGITTEGKSLICILLTPFSRIANVIV